VSVSPATNGSPRTATYQIIPPGGAWNTPDNGSYAISLEASQVFDTAGNAAAATALGSVEVNVSYTAFLPLVVREGVPDLVASISLSPSKQAFTPGEPVIIAVTVTNQGSGTAAPFWVDLYINPSSPPSAANQIWNARCGLTPCFGMAWAATSGLAPGQSITFTSQGSLANYSVWPGWFAAGTSDLYAFVDSYNPGVGTGAVAESNEANNRAELHGLVVAGVNPALVTSQSHATIPARPARIPMGEFSSVTRRQAIAP
jgi:CARDB